MQHSQPYEEYADRLVNPLVVPVSLPRGSVTIFAIPTEVPDVTNSLSRDCFFFSDVIRALASGPVPLNQQDRLIQRLAAFMTKILAKSSRLSWLVVSGHLSKWKHFESCGEQHRIHVPRIIFMQSLIYNKTVRTLGCRTACGPNKTGIRCQELQTVLSLLLPQNLRLRASTHQEYSTVCRKLPCCLYRYSRVSLVH